MAEYSQQQQRQPGVDPVDFGGSPQLELDVHPKEKAGRKESDSSSSSSEDESPNSSDAEGKSSKKRKHESEEEKRARKKAKKERKRERKERRRERKEKRERKDRKRPHHFTDIDLIGETGALDRGMGTPASGTLPRLGGSIV